MCTIQSSFRIGPRFLEPADGRPLAGRRILVVHDSPEITSVLADVLSAAGARVAVAHESTEANLLLAWGGHDLVFLDASLPGATDVLDLIRDHRPGLLSSTIVLTGDLRDRHSVTRLRTSYPRAFFRDSWLIDLVDVTTRVIEASHRRAAA